MLMPGVLGNTKSVIHLELNFRQLRVHVLLWSSVLWLALSVFILGKSNFAHGGGMEGVGSGYCVPFLLLL